MTDSETQALRTYIRDDPDGHGFANLENAGRANALAGILNDKTKGKEDFYKKVTIEVFRVWAVHNGVWADLEANRNHSDKIVQSAVLRGLSLLENTFQTDAETTLDLDGPTWFTGDDDSPGYLDLWVRGSVVSQAQIDLLLADHQRSASPLEDLWGKGRTITHQRVAEVLR